jgi:hypothetical protein
LSSTGKKLQLRPKIIFFYNFREKILIQVPVS